MIYISGKITGTDDYMERFEKVEKELTCTLREPVINPAKVNAQLPVECCYSDYITVSLALLSICDSIYMMRDWEDSKGARLEHDYAIAHDYHIMYENTI